MENRTVAFGFTGISLLVAIVALAFRGGPTVVAPPSPAEGSAAAAAQGGAGFSSHDLAIARYDRGRQLIGDYFGVSWEALIRSADSVARGQLAMLGAAGERATAAGAAPRVAGKLGLRVTIALVPDPYDSHLDWSYDANLEALRRAFGTAGYVPQSFWLPARAESLSIGDAGRQARLSSHDVHAGVMLFRSTSTTAPALHLLYIVPEVPTSGVHPLAFRSALAERAAILREGTPLFDPDPRERQELSILGPNFSGSATSLRTLVDANVVSPGDDAAAARGGAGVAPVTARMISGSATAFSNLAVLSDGRCVAVPARADTATEQVGRLRYAATVNPDEAMDEVLRALIRSLGIEPFQVALLTESGTGYGAGRPSAPQTADSAMRATAAAAPDCATAPPGTSQVASGAAPDTTSSGFLTVPFPVNIASLRVAFEQAPSARTPSQALPSLEEAPRTRLTLDDVGRPRESPPLASKLSVPSLDVVLASLVRTVQEHGVRLVVIKATDVRDKLMLARELRRGLQDVMVVLYEGHVLLRRAEYADALRGTLVLGSYPMALENQFWSTSHRRLRNDTAFTRLADLLALPTDAAIGVYNAALTLLDLPQHRVEFSLHNAFPPDSTYFLPPVWLTVVGRNGFYPLRATPPSGQWWPYLGSRDPRTASPVAAAERPHEHTYTHDDFSLSVLVIAPMLLMLLVVAMFLRGRKPLAMAPYFELPRFLERPGSSRESLFLALFLLSLVASYLPFSVAVDARRTISSLDPLLTGASTAMWAVGALSLLVVLVSLALLVNGWIGIVRRTPARAARDAQATAGRDDMLHRVGHVLAEMRGPPRATGEGPAIAAPEPPSDFERHTSRVEHPWMAHTGMAIITAASLAFVVSSLAYTVHLLQLASRGGPEATLAMYRAMHLTSGVSPLLPLVLLAVGFAIWTWWQLQQSRTLDHHDPFESGLRRLAVPADAEMMWRRMYRAIVDARRGMGWIAPGFGVAGIFVAVLLCAWFVSRRHLPSLEVIAQTGAADRAFDWALWLGLLSLLVSSSWAVFRLVHTWHGLERFLDVTAGTPVVNAFLRLPVDVVRVTDVGFLGFRRDGRGDQGYADELWETATRFAGDRAPAAADQRSPLAAALARVAQGTATRWERVQLAFRAAQEGWRASRARAQGGGKDLPLEGEPLPASRTRALRSLEEYLACEVVLFVEGYLRNLRRLCFFLFASLLILVVVSAQYPYQPRSIVALASLLLLGATVVSVFWVMVRLSRNETLSRISRTEPGRVTWDTSFVLNVVTFGVVPLLAFASSEFPAVRTFLFSWAEPLVRAVART